MKNITHRINLKTKARIAGIQYFIIFIVYPLASFFRKSQIIVSGEAMATANTILKNELFFRIGIAGEVVIFLMELVLTKVYREPGVFRVLFFFRRWYFESE